MTDYPKPSLTVDAIILAGQGHNTRLLVIQRANEPYKGFAALPGGFVDQYEQPFHAVTRELCEETGLEIDACRFAPLSLRARKGRDPRGWTLSQPFVFWLPEPAPVQAGDDARQAWWQPLDGLPRMAFDHGAILCEALGLFWEDMPTHAPVFKGIRPFGVPQSSSRHIFFGGSFNPWHPGHSACIDLCPQSDDLIIVPDSNPFKQGNNDGCYWQQFLEIVEKSGGNPERVFPGWWGSELPNPTANWFPMISGHNALLMGDDSLASLPRWLDSERLVKNLEQLFVAPRNTHQREIDKAIAWLQTQNPHCCVTFLEDHPHREASSTRIRDQKA